MDREARRVLRAIPNEIRTEPPFLGAALQLHQNAGRWPTAARIAGQLTRLQPEEAGWWIAHAYAVRRWKSIDEARKILLRAVSRHPEEPTIQFNLACYAAQTGDLPEAHSRLAKAIALQPAFAEMARTDPDLAPLNLPT
ncbi:MAG: hypothetical protein R3F07_01305 [Opitutaceae bacterium]